MINDLQIKTENGYHPLGKLTQIELEPLSCDDNNFKTYLEGDLSINLTEENNELFELIKKTKSTNKVYMEDTLGRKFEGNIYKEITNVHRKKKGKRYIIRFNYTGCLGFEGKLYGDERKFL